MAGYPIVHGVTAHHAHLRHLRANIALQHRIDVGQKEEITILVGRRHFGSKGLKDIQLGVEGLGLVQVLHVRAGPVEALARSVLQALRIHTAAREHGFMLRSEVFADHSDDADIGKVACGQSEIGCRSAKAPVAPPLRRLDAVKCNTAYYENGHGFLSVRSCTCSAKDPVWRGLPPELHPGW